MKKIISLLLIGITCIYSFAATPGIGDKVSKVKANNYRFFSGFDFGDIPAEKHDTSLEQRVNSEIDYVIAEDIETNNKSKYAIVGHSQGGLRVLAYATMLERRISDTSLTAQQRAQAKANYDRLAAVITISGVDKGLKALENNFTTLKSKALADGNIWLDGLRGVAKAVFAKSAFENLVLKKIGITSANDIITKASDILPGFADSYIVAGWNGEPYSKIPEVYDMVPRSNFINKNVSATTTVTYKKQTGTRTYKKWEKIKWCLWWWVEHTEPVYTTYTAYKDNPKFSKNMPVGYVVGMDSNTLGLAEEKESEIRKYCSTAATIFEVAQIANHAECYLTLGIGFLTGHYTAYQDCCTARDWFKNVDGELNDLKGSNENDGLVAKESQFYPKQFYNPATGKYEEVHSNVLGKDQRGYTEVKLNHRDINCDDTFNKVVIPMIKQVMPNN